MSKMIFKCDSIKLNASDTNFSYRIKFSTNGTFVINGENVIVSEYGKTYTFSSLPIIQYVQKRSKIIGYDTTEGFLTPEEYKTLISSLKEKYDSESDVWLDIDAEYMFKKTIQELNPISKIEEFEERIDVEIQVDNSFVLDTENKYITSDYFLGGNTPICYFDANLFAVDYFKQLCEENGLVSTKHDTDTNNCFYIPNHSGIRYAKINGKYMFGDEMNFQKGGFRGTFEKCVSIQKDIEKTIKDKTLSYLRLLSGDKKISNVELLSSLNSILTSLKKVDSKVATMSEYKHSKHLLETLISKI